MEIVTNDMIVYYQFRDKYEAIAQIKESIRILMRLKKETEFVRLSSASNVLRDMELSPGYHFGQLLNEANDLISANEKQLLKTLFVNYKKIELSQDVFTINEKKSSQCAWAVRNRAFLFSILIDKIWNKEKIIGNYETGTENRQVEINHISTQDHLEIHKKQLGIRIYEQNPKHKVNYGWGTEMDLSDEEAQKLLQTAVPVDRDYTHLVAKRNGKYYSFRCHYDNRYHGYWDDTMSEKNRKKAESVLCKKEYGSEM